MTVGLVIVSHSAQLARGVAELAGQMVKGATPIIAAGGAGEGILGTSTDTIAEAITSIQSANGSDGVLILLDLGSAILSAEMALELLNEEQRQRVRITFAPLVEGCIAAAIEASTGHTLAQVKQAAERIANVEQLQQLKPLTQSEEMSTASTLPALAQMDETSRTDAIETRLPLNNTAGLHARPASLFVQTAARFQASIEVQARERWADATSIIGVLSLGARQGDTITLRASGIEAQSAIEALSELVQSNFHETPAEKAKASSPAISTTSIGSGDSAPDTSATCAPQQPPGVVDRWHGIKTSAGVALGPALLYTSQTLTLNTIEPRTISANQVSSEQQRLRDALEATTQELQTLSQQLQSRIGQSEAAIFDAQAEMASDPELLATASQGIQKQHIDAAAALAFAGEHYATTLEALDDPLLAARATDVRDVTSRAIQHLRGQSQQDLASLTQPVILIARDLTPSDTATLRPEMVLGICTIRGGPTAHAAILARALGIPAIAGFPENMLQRIHTGDELGMDADNGMLYLAPQVEIHETLAQRLSAQRQRQTALKTAAQHIQEPLTLDGRRISLLANVGSEIEAEAARQWGAEGIGLLRTEFLFATASIMPDEEEQRKRYVHVFRAFIDSDSRGCGPIVVRTLDAGADKPMPALQKLLGPAAEANPALGLRGIRIHLAHEELLEQQLRALLLAAADTGVELHIMCPMITTVEELRRVRAIFTHVYDDLKQQQIPLPAHVPLGIMVEVPAAALLAPELAELADFFSIGANDLLQYTLAVDRINPALTDLYSPMQPAVLRLMQLIAHAGRRAGKPVAVCGEIASDPRLAPVLIGLGIDELSMTPTAIPTIRAALSGRSSQELTELAERVCHMSTRADIEEALQNE